MNRAIATRFCNIVLAVLILPMAGTYHTDASVNAVDMGRQYALYEPDNGQCYLGAYSENMDRFIRNANRSAALKLSYPKFYRDDPFDLDGPFLAGYTPVISWMPGNETINALPDIIAGKYDRYIHEMAAEVKAYDRPLFIRFGHEMNKKWYAYGGRPDEYVAAYRHVWQLFKDDGATTVAWVFCPNQDDDANWAPYYPGDRYVDWVGLDVYNKFTHPRTFEEGAANFYAYYKDIKPIMIAETASDEGLCVGKADYIRGMFDTLAKWPDIKALCWFDKDKYLNGRYQLQEIGSSAGSGEAFMSGVAQPGYITAVIDDRYRA